MFPSPPQDRLDPPRSTTPGRAPLSVADAQYYFDAFSEHARYVSELSRYTLAWYRQSFANLRRFLAEGTSPLPSTPADLDRWIAWNRKRGIARDTVNSYWRAMRAFFKYLEDSSGFPNPYRGAKRPRLPRPEDRLRDALPPQDLQRIIDSAESYTWKSALLRTRAVALIGIMVYAGLRKSEVLRLKFAHVNLQGGAIYIHDGKGRDGGKSRTVYMPAALRVILARYIQARANVQHRGVEKRGYTCPEFFVSSRGNRGLSEMQFRRFMRAMQEASGIRFFAHLLRHSYITMLVTERVPLHDVQRLAGHSDLKTTAIYLHANDDRMRVAVERLDVGRRAK
ncbi:MAG: integrase/recombinase XerD [Thermoanaerobaculia bacterium]|jgi:site-specific recombinase XerD|nr:integrase/recombinase XerD [Thermoanaerobaculia bacterium]